jgi:hypothetical protein
MDEGSRRETLGSGYSGCWLRRTRITRPETGEMYIWQKSTVQGVDEVSRGNHGRVGRVELLDRIEMLQCERGLCVKDPSAKENVNRDDVNQDDVIIIKCGYEAESCRRLFGDRCQSASRISIIATFVSACGL